MDAIFLYNVVLYEQVQHSSRGHQACLIASHIASLVVGSALGAYGMLCLCTRCFSIHGHVEMLRQIHRTAVINEEYGFWWVLWWVWE